MVPHKGKTTMTFAESIPLLLQGKKDTRKVWESSGYYWWINDESRSYKGLLMSNSYNSPDVGREDLEATDWEVIGD